MGWLVIGISMVLLFELGWGRFEGFNVYTYPDGSNTPFVPVIKCRVFGST